MQPKVRVGDTYGNLVVLERVENSGGGKSRWLCQCECGKQTMCMGSDLTCQKRDDCGDRMHRKITTVDWNNPEQVREYYRERGKGRRAAMSEDEKKERAEQIDKWRIDNREHVNEMRRRNRAANLEEKRTKDNLYNHAHPEVSLLSHAKQRAKEKGLDFSVEKSDVIVPTICPLLGIPVFKSEDGFTANSPTIDRIDNTKGYVKGNVWVISWRANHLKWRSTLEEVERMVAIVDPILESGGIWYPDGAPYIWVKTGTGIDLRRRIWRSARDSSRKRGLDFSIEYSDVVIPDVCPVLGIPLFRAKGGLSQEDNSPTLDRIDSTKGYVKGNVWIISWRANSVKRDGTIDEYKSIIKGWRAKLEELRLLKAG